MSLTQTKNLRRRCPTPLLSHWTAEKIVKGDTYITLEDKGGYKNEANGCEKEDSGDHTDGFEHLKVRISLCANVL